MIGGHRGKSANLIVENHGVKTWRVHGMHPLNHLIGVDGIRERELCAWVNAVLQHLANELFSLRSRLDFWIRPKKELASSKHVATVGANEDVPANHCAFSLSRRRFVADFPALCISRSAVSSFARSTTVFMKRSLSSCLATIWGELTSFCI